MAHCVAVPVYEHCHTAAVVFEGAHTSQRTILLRITKIFSDNLVVKLSEVDNYGFSYTCEIDRSRFERMKLEQSLEINFEELQSQLIELLKETMNDRMYLRLEADAARCKMVFYEKARLKSLIFLTVELVITDQAEIIDEMARNIAKLKDQNRNLSCQLTSSRAELQDKAALLEASLTTSKVFEQQVKKDIETIERVFCTTVSTLEKMVNDNLTRLSRRHLKLLNDVDVIRAENRLKCESSARLVNLMHNLRLENERNVQAVDELRMEVNHLKILKANAEEGCAGSRQAAARREREIDELRMQIDELKKDLQDATMIIAQKTKTHDEIAKDLVQANNMIVNFNNQYDNLSKEFDEAKETLKTKDRHIREQAALMARVSEDFNRYKAQYNTEEVNKLKQELCFTKQNLHELEKQNKEAVKLNGLLTRKLSSSSATQLNMHNNVPPSQRTNY